MKKNLLSIILVIMALLLSGCSSEKENDSGQSTSKENMDSATSISSAEVFSDRDFEVGYDESNSVIITLNGETAICESNAVQISGSTVKITDEGTYIISGDLENGMIIVDTEKTDKTQLVLDGVSIHNETTASVYILQSDKVFITLAPDSENNLSNGGSFENIDENNIDAVIFSKEDLTLNGSGSLKITSPAGHGIVSKDELAITSGIYEINAASHGLSGKDDIGIANATLNITAGKDGIRAENEDDETLGFVYIESGTYHINVEGDGISASSHMQIEGGTFEITSGGGSVNGKKKTSDSWGDFMGGGHGQMGGGPGGMSAPGGRGENSIENGSIDDSITSEDDSTSIKGMKATGNLIINGGNFKIDSADDAVHSNTSITVTGGSFEIASGDDAFHADYTLTITSCNINITESYEGLEGLHVVVSGGEITLYASDDGINAAGGTDESGFGGHRENDKFGGMGSSSASKGSITISGGKLYINASGDGIDANGTLTISGGYTTVCGPTKGDTATLDYDTSAIITGGTFVGTGASSMAQTFSDSEQGVIAVSVGNQAAGTNITLTDSKGNTIISYEPELSFAVVILSSQDLIQGETYTITVGSTSGEFEAE